MGEGWVSCESGGLQAGIRFKFVGGTWRVWRWA